jgi:uncharacterized membrane protein
VFVLLTGLSAWLYGQRQADPRRATATFLLKRGLFLVVLELTLVNFAWTFQLPPETLYLQVIWAIGLSMIALAGLLWLPRPALLVLAIAVVAGHNLFDGLRCKATACWRCCGKCCTSATGSRPARCACAPPIRCCRGSG